MRKLKLSEEIQNIIGEWLYQQGLSISDDKCEILDKQIMQTINKRANKIDVGEMIKCLMWDKRKSISYGDISEYIEKRIVKEFR
jgi:hypothetical protein